MDRLCDDELNCIVSFMQDPKLFFTYLGNDKVELEWYKSKRQNIERDVQFMYGVEYDEFVYRYSLNAYKKVVSMVARNLRLYDVKATCEPSAVAFIARYCLFNWLDPCDQLDYFVKDEHDRIKEAGKVTLEIAKNHFK